MQKGKVNMSLCKKIQYSILNNKKLDWLKREKEWRLDRILFYLKNLEIDFMLQKGKTK